MAWIVVLASLGLFILVAPFAQRPLSPVWAFIPIYESAMIITDLVTALLLFGQFRLARSKALLVLTSGYLFTALGTVAHGLTFPGLFSATGLFGAGPQSTAWLYMFWHGGFPLFVAAYVVLSDRGHTDSWGGQVAGGWLVGGAGFGVAVLVAAATLIVTVGHDALPSIMQSNHYTPVMIGVVTAVWLASFSAAALLWRHRSRTILDLWLMVVMCAWMFDIALSALVNAGRFDLGFYVGRLYGLLATSAVLGMLLVENGLLHARLLRAHAQERQRCADLLRLNDRLEALNAQVGESNRQLQEQTRLKSEFLANMSHELRTPLNAIIGFSAMLKDGLVSSPSDQRTFAGHVFDGGHHLLALINDMLDLSKIEAGKADLELDTVHLDAAIADALVMMAPQAKAKGVVFTVDRRASVGPLRVHGRRLKQILLNLMSNATKFTSPGGQVTIGYDLVDRCRASSALPGWQEGMRKPLPASDFERFVEISVSDTGIGMEATDMRRLLTPFTQILNVATRGLEGTGLGLVMVHRLAELHGGSVAVTSAPGVGTCFTVWLPWRDGAESLRDVARSDSAWSDPQPRVDPPPLLPFDMVGHACRDPIDAGRAAWDYGSRHSS